MMEDTGHGWSLEGEGHGLRISSVHSQALSISWLVNCDNEWRGLGGANIARMRLVLHLELKFNIFSKYCGGYDCVCFFDLFIFWSI